MRKHISKSREKLFLKMRERVQARRERQGKSTLVSQRRATASTSVFSQDGKAIGGREGEKSCSKCELLRFAPATTDKPCGEREGRGGEGKGTGGKREQVMGMWWIAANVGGHAILPLLGSSSSSGSDCNLVMYPSRRRLYNFLGEVS